MCVPTSKSKRCPVWPRTFRSWDNSNIDVSTVCLTQTLTVEQLLGMVTNEARARTRLLQFLASFQAPVHNWPKIKYLQNDLCRIYYCYSGEYVRRGKVAIGSKLENKIATSSYFKKLLNYSNIDISNWDILSKGIFSIYLISFFPTIIHMFKFIRFDVWLWSIRSGNQTPAIRPLMPTTWQVGQ